LDGVQPPGFNNTLLVRAQIRDANRLVQRADAYCQFDASCPLHAAGNGSVVSAFKEIVVNASAGAYLNGTNATSSVSLADVQAVTALAYFHGSPMFPVFNEAVAAASAGDIEGFSFNKLLGPGYSSGTLGVLPVICSDYCECFYFNVEIRYSDLLQLSTILLSRDSWLFARLRITRRMIRLASRSHRI
jgi:hypothetical protein